MGLAAGKVQGLVGADRPRNWGPTGYGVSSSVTFLMPLTSI
jgi:hypothetical protein